MGLVHSFDPDGQVNDMPQSDQVDGGNVYDTHDWPCTNLEPHDISNIMGYEIDACMSHMTHDHCVPHYTALSMNANCI